MHHSHEFIRRLASLTAYGGGVMLCLLIAVTCISITGRALNGFLHGDFMQSLAPGLADSLIALGIGPVNGDFELVKAGMAFAIFCFLPHCQLQRGHASVDVLARFIPPRPTRLLAWLADMLFAIALIVIAWQLTGGLFDKWRAGETSFHLELPVWWFYAAALWGAVMAALVALYIAALRSVEFFTGHPVALLEADSQDDMGDAR